MFTVVTSTEINNVGPKWESMQQMLDLGSHMLWVSSSLNVLTAVVSHASDSLLALMSSRGLANEFISKT